MRERKVIGICMPKILKNNAKTIVPNISSYWCPETIVNMIVKNNCIPMFIQYNKNFIDYYLQKIDGLVLGGGYDIHPKHYGKKLKKVDKEMGLMCNERMAFQKKIIEKILIKKEKKVPILGICAGMQSINVILGGTLIQDIETEIKSPINHRNAGRKLRELAHDVVLEKNSFLYDITNKERFSVTTNHHQAIEKVAEGLKVTAISPEDGIIEAVEYMGDEFCIGLQWHLERYATEEDIKIAKSFFNVCKGKRISKRVA